MRRLLPLLLLATSAVAEPLAVKDFRRLRKLRDDVVGQIKVLKEAEEFALKPAEEKMLLAFEKNEKKFDNKPLTGKLVVTTCLLKWDAVQRAEPTEPAKRVLARLPNVLFQKYTRAIEIPKDRKEVANLLVDGLDSDFLHVRLAAFEALKLMYHTPNGLFYNPTMSKKDRQESIKKWDRLVTKQG
jgi:hypothetical protein